MLLLVSFFVRLAFKLRGGEVVHRDTRATMSRKSASARASSGVSTPFASASLIQSRSWKRFTSPFRMARSSFFSASSQATTFWSVASSSPVASSVPSEV
ncbi:hypothetical protein AUC71_07520 [Methyloceanibacter marginalis]|uniref:Uncharacterized protein n=1 Tax=Methyloceanibacter marginalis TaxID=1774971 RepID=A0A1E3WFL4_9HYPH|nr:hypothetical protein AUC71_07520 [Methyloceanibacter marginalis]